MRMRDWLDRIPLTDPIQQRLARFFQIVLLGWVLLATLGIPLNVLRNTGVAASDPPLPPPEAIPPIFLVLGWLLLVATLMLWLSPVIALVLLRRGRFNGAVLMAIWGLLFGHSIATFTLGVADPSVYVVFQIPIALAALLGGRRLLITVAGYSILFVLLIGFLQLQNPPAAGFFSMATLAAMNGTGPALDLAQPLVFFVATTLLTSLLLERFGNSLREALNQSLHREAELQAIRVSLESTVSERTAELQEALNEAKERSVVQARLLDELEAQRDTIRELSVPVLPISQGTLVMPLVGTLDSARLRQIQEQALSQLEATRARRLILDITGVPIVDTQVAQGLIRVVQAARLLGSDVTLVGIRPEVAQSIVGLGLDLSGIHTFSNLQGALSSRGARA